MKILQISHGYNAPFLGVSNHYACMLTSKGDVTSLYLSGEEAESVRQQTEGAQVLFWELNAKRLKGAKIGLIWKLYKFIREEQFDLVLCHRYKAIYMAAVCQLLGLRFRQIGVIHGFGDFKRAARRVFLSLFKNRLMLLGVSNAVRDDIRKSMPSFPVDKVQTLYNAIDVAAVASKQLDKEKARAFLGLNDQAFIIGNVGRLHPDKDQATLIRAFSEFHKQYANSQLVILGCGRLEQQLKDLARELGVEKEVLFLGQVPDAVNYYKAFDVFALTSDREPFGLVLLEAIVAKVPVVASDCGGASEVVADAGYLFEFANVADLTCAIQKVYAGSTETLVEQAFEKLHERYSIAATTKVLTALCDDE
jgi:glycosyltransferase involved in cell wall biosynthesis